MKDLKTEQAAKKRLDTYLQKHELTKRGLKREKNKYAAKEKILDIAWVMSVLSAGGFSLVAAEDMLYNTTTEEFRPILWALTIGAWASIIATSSMYRGTPEQRAFISKLSNKYHKNRLAKNRALYAQEVK